MIQQLSVRMHVRIGGIEHSHLVHLSAFNLSPNFIVNVPNLHVKLLSFLSCIVFVLFEVDNTSMVSFSDAKNGKK